MSLRWAQEGHGKSGGIRVIYYWVTEDDIIYLLLAYAKNEADDLSDAQVKQLKKLVESEFG